MEAIPIFLQKMVKAIPGEQYIGPYRTIPLFFIGGATFQFCFYQCNMYNILKIQQARQIVEQRLNKEKIQRKGISIPSLKLPILEQVPKGTAKLPNDNARI